ncbi:MAG: hypothetical protein RL557_256 [archaeon]|jgi:hypothetical protein
MIEVNSVYHIDLIKDKNTLYDNFVLTLNHSVATELLNKKLPQREYFDWIERFKGDHRIDGVNFVRIGLSERTTLLEYLRIADKKITIFQGDLSKLRAGSDINVRYSSLQARDETDQKRLLNVFDAYLQEFAK